MKIKGAEISGKHTYCFSRLDLYKTFISKCELFSSSLSVNSKSRNVFKQHRALKKDSISQNLTIDGILLQLIISQAGYVIIYLSL